MADEIKTNEPNVGIRGNPASLPQLKSSEKIQPHGTIPNFVSAFDALATTPTVLGQLTSQLVTSASNQLMDKWGYELGSNPHGNLLPAITDADKRLANAYSNQAHATLSLQADKMLMDGQTEIAKADKITPGMVTSYQANMASGLADILKDAPDSIKPQLNYNMGASLNRSTNQINNRLITQQKNDYKDSMLAFSSVQTKNMYEAGMSGNSDEARRLYDSQVALNEQLHEEGVITAVQAENSNQTARQTMLTGIYTQQAMEAKRDGTLEEFLSQFPDKKEKDISFLDWEAVENNVLTNMGQIDRLEQRDKSLMVAQFDLSITEGNVTADKIDELRASVPEETFLRSMIKYKTALNAKNSTQNAIAELANPNNWGSPVAQADATAKTKNATFQALAQDYAEKNQVSAIEAKIHVQQAAGAAIPQFTQELNNMMQSGDPNLMIQAKSAYTVLGNFKAPLNAQSLKYSYALDALIAQGKMPIEAAQIVKERMGDISPEMLAGLDSQWKQYSSDHLKDFPSQVRNAKNLLDIPSFSNVPNLPAIVDKANKALETNFYLTKDINAARQMTQDNLSMSYGVTYANGNKQFTYLPLEKFTLVDKDHMGIIQNDAALQVESQLAPTKDAYDKGHADFYYRIKRRGDVNEAIRNKKYLDENLHGKGIGHFAESELREEINAKINSYTKNEPIEIEKVWRYDQPEVFEMVINSNENIGLGINSQTPIDGAYSIAIKSRRTGGITPLIGIDNASHGQIFYRPNIQKINQDTLALLGLTDNGQSIQKAKERFLALGRSESPATNNLRLF